jgi:protein phosphatase
MKPEQASKAYPKNVITRSLGPEPSVEVDIEGPVPVEPGDVFVLCSDGLSGPVTDREIGALASQFHPEDACRYLVHLANLRGGQDNITVVIVRIGPWVEPGSSNGQAEEEATASKPKGSLFSSLIGSLRSKPAEPEVEEHVYQTDDCSLAPKLVAGINDVLKNAQAVAVDQTWGLDWAELSRERKAAEAAFTAGQHREALKHLAEAAAILGTAARLHRKETQKNGH